MRRLALALAAGSMLAASPVPGPLAGRCHPGQRAPRHPLPNDSWNPYGSAHTSPSPKERSNDQTPDGEIAPPQDQRARYLVIPRLSCVGPPTGRAGRYREENRRAGRAS